jgi:hypothetical protein
MSLPRGHFPCDSVSIQLSARLLCLHERQKRSASIAGDLLAGVALPTGRVVCLTSYSSMCEPSALQNLHKRESPEILPRLFLIRATLGFCITSLPLSKQLADFCFRLRLSH